VDSRNSTAFPLPFVSVICISALSDHSCLTTAEDPSSSILVQTPVCLCCVLVARQIEVLPSECFATCEISELRFEPESVLFPEIPRNSGERHKDRRGGLRQQRDSSHRSCLLAFSFWTRAVDWFATLAQNRQSRSAGRLLR
jgi:hypothetical protein